MEAIRTGAASALALACALVFSARAQTPLPDSAQKPPQALQGYWKQAAKADLIVEDEARCKAYPDLPGNQWRAGAAQARCSLLRAPAWSLDQIDALLAKPDGPAELQRRFAQLLKAHYQDRSQREQIFRALAAFDKSERAAAVAQRWLSLAPDSGFAQAALANHYVAVGSDARGSRSVGQTDAGKMELMRDMFVKAVPLYGQALEAEPSLSVACAQLAVIGRYLSDGLEKSSTEHCLRIDPDSYYVVYGRIMASQPNWGGSMEQMREAVDYAAQRTERNPVLGAVLAEAEGFEVSPQAGVDPLVAADLARVSRIAPSGTLMNYAGDAYSNDGDYWQAFVHHSQATRFWPHNARFRYDRGWVLMHLGQYEWAARDLAMAAQAEPNNDFYVYAAAESHRRWKGLLAARPYNEQLMTLGDGHRQFAMGWFCESFIVEQPFNRRALDCTAQYLQEFPSFGPALGLRAKALYLAKDPGARAAVDEFLAKASVGFLLDWKGLLDEAKQWKLALDQAPAVAR